MKVFVDANVLLDVLQNREPHVNASSIVWKACECGEIEGVVSALTFASPYLHIKEELDTGASARYFAQAVANLFIYRFYCAGHEARGRSVRDAACFTQNSKLLTQNS